MRSLLPPGYPPRSSSRRHKPILGGKELLEVCPQVLAILCLSSDNEAIHIGAYNDCHALAFKTRETKDTGIRLTCDETESFGIKRWLKTNGLCLSPYEDFVISNLLQWL